MSLVKNIGGKQYRFIASKETKSAANAIAEKIRSDGKSARVIPAIKKYYGHPRHKVYEVWMRR